jgi:hypothetical protein
MNRQQHLNICVKCGKIFTAPVHHNRKFCTKDCFHGTNAVPPKNVNDVILAYAAGIVDGEGSIGIYREKRKNTVDGFSLTVTVKMKSLETIRFFCEHFQGFYSFDRKGRLHCWRITDRQAEIFLRQLSPFMVTKKRHAELALEFRTHKWEPRPPHSRTGCFQPISRQLIELRQTYVHKMSQLNHSYN